MQIFSLCLLFFWRHFDWLPLKPFRVVSPSCDFGEDDSRTLFRKNSLSMRIIRYEVFSRFWNRILSWKRIFPNMDICNGKKDSKNSPHDILVSSVFMIMKKKSDEQKYTFTDSEMNWRSSESRLILILIREKYLLGNGGSIFSLLHFSFEREKNSLRELLFFILIWLYLTVFCDLLDYMVWEQLRVQVFRISWYTMTFDWLPRDHHRYFLLQISQMIEVGKVGKNIPLIL